MSVVICGHKPLLTESLALVLQRSGFEVRAVTAHPSEAVAAVRQTGSALCLMDLDFPDTADDPVAAVRQLLAQSPSTSVLMLTSRQDPQAHALARSIGAAGVARMDEDVAAVVATLHRVLDGEPVVDHVRPYLAPAPRRRPTTDTERLLEQLTPRENEVLELLQRGVSTSSIAQRMGVTYSTARSHIQSVLVKLGVHSRLEAAAFATGNLTTPRAFERSS